MPTVGSGRYTYEMVEDWAKLPRGQSFDKVTSVAVDSRDRVYVFQRTDPPILVFGRDGNFLSSWGNGTITFGHGIHIGRDDYIYLTDRDDHVAVKFTLDGKPVQVLGARGQPSDTGCTEDAGTVPRAAGPFNMADQHGPRSLRRPVRRRWLPQQPGPQVLRWRRSHPLLGQPREKGSRRVPRPPLRVGEPPRNGIRVRP